MLAALGYASRAALMDAIVPPAIRERAPLPLPGPRDRSRRAREARRRSPRSNRVLKSFIGQGYYGTHTPGVILRNILENPAWYTAYTPYQPEIAQGRLEALVNFQTMVCDLTGMAIANASMLDEATAAAEAMTLALRVGKSASRALLRGGRRVRRRRSTSCARARRRSASRWSSGRRATRPRADAFARAAAVSGRERRRARLPRARRRSCTRSGALVIVAADLLALTLLAPPGEWGADAVVGSSQRFGVPMGYGGPHAGYLATRDEFKRSLPGRLVGVTVDADGDPAYRLALQTREQHIRREKATSNICTAQVLLAVIASMYAVYHGPEGLTRIARRVHRLTAILQGRPRAARLRRADRRALRHDRRRDRRRARRRIVDARRRGGRQLPPRRRDARSASRSTRRRRATTSSASGGSSTARRRRSPSPTSIATSTTRCRRRSRARRRSSRTRCSIAIARKRRCCATCAGSPTATWRSTAR